VTGTNGKTTTSSMIAAIVARSGETRGLVTTLGAWVGDEPIATEATSEAFEAFVRRASAAHLKTLVIETTSQALEAGFAARWPPQVAVFTNLTHDHLDAHGTLEAYLAAKAQLFMNLLPGGVAIFNAADEASALLAEVVPPHARCIAYCIGPVDPACASLDVQLAADSVRVDETGTHLVLAGASRSKCLGDDANFSLAIHGEVHAQNALGAALAGEALGISPDVIRAALSSFPGVPGRFQIVAPRGERAPLVVVDFAHTPDALERTLLLARSLVRGRVTVVFGCGGDRDQAKRAPMGAIAARLADTVIITNDNPRSEDPEHIARAIASGAGGTSARVLRMLDRALAIREAVLRAAPEDIVVIAGKGHERTQLEGNHEVPFDDVEVARYVVTSDVFQRVAKED
jgi:UDP-N-acetylmuramoyl-L-alanyl-D-glutamate--2,6-diaminopimelate ligase